MFNIQIGAPNVYSEAIQEIAIACANDGSYVFKYIEQDTYTKSIAQYVDFEGRDLAEVLQRKWIASNYLRSVANTAYVFASDPKLLGNRSDFLRKGKAFPSVEGRIARIHEILHDHEVTLHLMVLDQVSFIMARVDVPMERRIRALLASRLSWANVAGRVLRFAPNSNLIVWNMENPKPALMAFCKAISPSASQSVTESVTSILSKIPTINADQVTDDQIRELKEIVLLLDDRFEDDLERIDCMPRATVRYF
jgi:hypothetical protein